MAANFHRIFLTIAAFFALCLWSAPAASAQLSPFKDELFAYPTTVSTGDDGAYLVVDYREARDINGRDAVPERRVSANYVDASVRKVQQDLVLRSDLGDIRHFAVGQTEGASLVTVYLHGQGGSRKQGVDDFTFGGNFNRLKNLMAKNGGLYLSPDFTDFGEKGTAQVAALIAHYAETSPNAGVIIACGSMGGHLCWNLAANKSVAAKLSGLVLLGSLWNEDFFKSAAFKRRVPVFFGQGSRDTVFPVEQQEAFFRSIRAKASSYPTRFVRFETGTHGTPIRMVDWRDAINWALAAK